MRNPRTHLPPEKFCEYIYPRAHPKEGEQCGAVKMRGSEFCFFHQPDPEKREMLLKQLSDARDIKAERKMTHGFYSKTGLECDRCSLADGCRYYEMGKKACDYNIVPKIDFNTLSDIQKFAEEITKTEYKRYQKLEPYFQLSEELNLNLHDASSRIAGRLFKILKDYASIKEIYEKKQGTVSWKDILRDAA